MTVQILKNVILVFNYWVVFYFIVLNGTYILLTVLSFIAIRGHLRASGLIKYRKLFQSSFYKPVSVIAPAFNEESTILASVRSLLQLRYPEYEIIVVNDGSSDNTLSRMIAEFKLRRYLLPVNRRLACRPIRGIYVSADYPNLVVVDKENGGKADALNAGVNVSKYPLVSAIDSDSLLEPEVLLKLVRPFLENESTIAAGGIIRVANGCGVRAGEVVTVDLPSSWLARFQVVEYIRAFLFGRVGWEMINGLIVISGAFGLFRKDLLIACGGYRHDTVGEDMELVVRLHRYMLERGLPYRISYVAEPICWTEVPEDIGSLARQRNRWQRGLIDTIVMHRDMLLNPRYRVPGMFAMPFGMVFEMIGPVIEVAGYISLIVSLVLGIVDYEFALLFLAAAVGLGVVLSISAIILDEMTFGRYPRYRHLYILALVSVLENFGYRQLHSWWRFMGVISYLRGNRAWGRMKRKGY